MSSLYPKQIGRYWSLRDFKNLSSQIKVGFSKNDSWEELGVERITLEITPILPKSRKNIA